MSRARLLIVSVIIAGLLAACATGPRQVRGELPLVSIETLQRSGDRLTITLALRNINDHGFDIHALHMELSIDGVDLTTGAGDEHIAIAARSRELVTINGRASSSGMERLDQLAEGQRSSLQWEMDLTLTDERGRQRRTDATGWLHGVPGQRDRFR